jgi:hypothetical protein
MNSKVLALVAIISIIMAGLLIVTIGIGTDGSALAKKYKKTQTLAQVNSCGNYILPTNVTCSNSDSEKQGDGNSINSVTLSLLPFP